MAGIFANSARAWRRGEGISNTFGTLKRRLHRLPVEYISDPYVKRARKTLKSHSFVLIDESSVSQH